MGNFRIATYNVNSVRTRLPIIIPWLRRHRPDVLCMQETKVMDRDFPSGDFAAIGYQVVFRGVTGYNGVAVASLEEAKEVAFGLDDGGPSDEDRLIRCLFNGMAVVNTYVPQGRERGSPHFAYKLEWFRRLRAFFARLYDPQAPLLWCGDLNVAPEALDVHDPKRLLGHVCFTPEVWEAFALVKSWGLEDLFRRHHPGEGGRYTFFDYRVPRSIERGLGWRVDHILTTAPLARKSIDCTIDMEARTAEKPSDHTILIATFNL
jgi:exodeoxyribonuclease-3